MAPAQTNMLRFTGTRSVLLQPVTRTAPLKANDPVKATAPLTETLMIACVALAQAREKTVNALIDILFPFSRKLGPEIWELCVM